MLYSYYINIKTRIETTAIYNVHSVVFLNLYPSCTFRQMFYFTTVHPKLQQNTFSIIIISKNNFFVNIFRLQSAPTYNIMRCLLRMLFFAILKHSVITAKQSA